MKLKKNPDAVYKTCMYCGLEWNVSRFDKYEYYICPKCRREVCAACKQHKN